MVGDRKNALGMLQHQGTAPCSTWNPPHSRNVLLTMVRAGFHPQLSQLTSSHSAPWK